MGSTLSLRQSINDFILNKLALLENSRKNLQSDLQISSDVFFAPMALERSVPGSKNTSEFQVSKKRTAEFFEVRHNKMENHLNWYGKRFTETYGKKKTKYFK